MTVRKSDFNRNVSGFTGVGGVTGPTGVTGVQGPTGVQGATGEGVQGDTGDQGLPGPQGQTGEQGIPGPVGLGAPYVHHKYVYNFGAVGPGLVTLVTKNVTTKLDYVVVYAQVKVQFTDQDPPSTPIQIEVQLDGQQIYGTAEGLWKVPEIYTATVAPPVAALNDTLHYRLAVNAAAGPHVFDLNLIVGIPIVVIHAELTLKEVNAVQLDIEEYGVV